MGGRSKKKFEAHDILSETFVSELHRRMYSDVWRWAGEFRKTNKNIGIDKLQIPTQVRQLTDDSRFWLENKTYLPDEIAIRFKHRVVFIHCFPNGNGRHSRLMADTISRQIFKGKNFSWSGDRSNYIQSLKMADRGDISRLLAFARS